MLYSSLMRDYELVIMLPSAMPDKQKKDITARVKTEIDKAGAKKVDQEVWAAKPLAYPIAKKETADYFLYRFSSDEQKIKLMEKNIRLDENILRYLLVRV